MKKNPLVGSFKSRKFRKFIKRVINRWKFIQKVRKGSVNVSILKEYTEAYAINTPDINDNFLFVVNSFNNMLSGFTIGSIDKSEGNSMMIHVECIHHSESINVSCAMRVGSTINTKNIRYQGSFGVVDRQTILDESSKEFFDNVNDVIRNSIIYSIRKYLKRWPVDV